MKEPPAAISFALNVPEGDNRERRVCQTCGFVDYVNPRVVVGTLAHSGGRVLLCRRAIHPRRGYWTLPAGFMEEAESVEEGARREAREEANAELEIEGLLAVYSIPRISQVQIMFRARLLNDPSPGPESLEVMLTAWDDIPWAELASPSVGWALRQWRETAGKTVFVPFGNPPGTNELTR
ncbi:MAG: NUDIX hydrolase [Alphaproteobacteria bacterium]|nr:NUDIX hydrolase [Alphaproteobacteria bacterium]